MEPLVLVILGKVLMFVFIIGNEIDLGYFLGYDPSIDFGERAHLQAPIIGDIYPTGQTREEAEFTGQGITEGSMIGEKTTQFV
jgi:hypothetical protein